MSYKKTLYVVTTLFIGLLIFLTFFSRTILDLTIPRVSVQFVQQGVIQPRALASGITTPANTLRVFSPATGRITAIAQVGDTLAPGDVIFSISSDVQHLENMLEDLQHELRVTTLGVEQATMSRNEAQQRLFQLQNQPIDTPLEPNLNLFEFTLQLEAIAITIQDIEDDIATLTLLYAEGIIPRQDVIAREVDLARALQNQGEIYTRQTQAIYQHELALESHDTSILSLARTRNEQIAAQENIITGHNFTITSQNLNGERIRERIANLQEQIQLGGTIYVLLEGDIPQVITDLYVDIGATVVEGSPILSTYLQDHIFTIQASFPQRHEFIAIGQGAEVAIGSHHLNGITTEISPAGAVNHVYVEIFAPQLIGGELATVTIHGTRISSNYVIPLSALRQNVNDHYILYLTPQSRRLGMDYIVTQMPIDLDIADIENAAIRTRWEPLPNGPIIINSDMPVTAGMRVRMVVDQDFEWTR